MKRLERFSWLFAGLAVVAGVVWQDPRWIFSAGLFAAAAFCYRSAV